MIQNTTYIAIIGKGCMHLHICHVFLCLIWK